MNSIQFSDDAKKQDGGPILITKKPRVFLKNLTEEERLQRLADFAQARRDYIKKYYKENAAYRAASKERSKVFSRNYYHTNPDYKQKTIERAKEASKKKYQKVSEDTEKTNNSIN